jgi:hypothetical protein
VALIQTLSDVFSINGIVAVRHASIAGAILVWALFSTPALAATLCAEPATGTKDFPAFSPPLGEVVIGTGRLQFFSAPDPRCPMRGVFVVPGDQVIAYAQSTNGWSSVMYSNPKTGTTVSGWVRSARLKEMGTVGPRR